MAKKTIASLEEEIKNLNERLNSSYKTIEKFMSENSKLRDKADDDFKDSSLYMQMNKKIKNLEMKLKIQDSTINTLKSCEDRLIKQKDEFLDEIEQLKNEIEHLKVAPDDDIKKIKYENFMLSCELRKLKANAPSSHQKIINENEELKAEIIEYKDKISNIQLENNLLKGLNETLKINKDIDKNISQNNNATIKMLEAENEKLKKENEELKNNNFQKNIEQNNIEKVKRLENKIDNLMRENADLKTNAAINAGDLQIKLDRAIARNKNIINDYAKCSKMNEQLKKQLKELQDKQVGRPKKINTDIVQKVVELREAKKSLRAIAKELNISLGSVHNIIEQSTK